MKRPYLAVGLDIGASKISAVAAELSADGAYRVIGQVTSESAGMSRGSVSDMAEATRAVTCAISKLKFKSARKDIREVYVAISGTDLKCAISRGMIPISMRGREITRRDMARCAQVAGTAFLPIDREVLHRITHSFSADDQPWVSDPAGLYASRLSCEVSVVTADSNHIQNITKCVNNSGCDVKEAVFTCLADYSGLSSQNDGSGRVVLLDIGRSLMAAAEFVSGSMKDLLVLPFGSSDLKAPYREDPGFCQAVTSLSEKFFASDPAGSSRILVTGGMSFEDGLIEFLEERLLRPVSMGVVRGLRGDVSATDAVRLSTAIGLTKYAHLQYREKLAESASLKRLTEKVTDIFNNYF